MRSSWASSRFTGGWTRRWISDDGLIVLRTVRNLLAGNGPSSTPVNASRPTPPPCGST
ncbi:hypothetical protein QP028_08525 [Corynebacterium suedekumii]|nr:hypothetical protein QP028_08525 [Corynebacterium suedekumii]